MAAREDFTEARVVRLKTGGPFMMVEAVRTDEAVACVWFSGEMVCRDAFHFASLDLLPDSALNPPVMKYTASDIASGVIPIGCENINEGSITWIDDRTPRANTPWYRAVK